MFLFDKIRLKLGSPPSRGIQSRGDTNAPPASNAPAVSSRSDEKKSIAESISLAPYCLTAELAKNHGFRLVQEGNPQHGTILIMGGTHWCNDYFYRDEEEQKPLIEEIFTSQKQILLDLAALKVKHVFVEDLFFDRSHKDLEGPDWQHLKEKKSSLRKLFSGLSPETRFTDGMKRKLAKSDAGHVHFYLNDDVTLHMTTTPELFRHNMRIHEQVRDNMESDLAKQILFTNREREAMSHIKRFQLNQAVPA